MALMLTYRSGPSFSFSVGSGRGSEYVLYAVPPRMSKMEPRFGSSGELRVD